jgi:hypothetical protein
VARAGRHTAAGHARSRTPSAAARIGRRATVGVAVSALFLIGLSARTILQCDPDLHHGLLAAGTQHQSGEPFTEFRSRREYTGAELSTAVNQLFVSVKRSVAENGDLPECAREKIAWLSMQRRSRQSCCSPERGGSCVARGGCERGAPAPAVEPTDEPEIHRGG